MLDILSQSQIDTLLNAIRSGDKNLEHSSDDSQERRYRKYDFNSPRKFTKDRIKVLNGIFENYTRILNSRLNAQLHTNCDMSVESIEEQRYYEFSNALTDGDVLAIAQASLEGEGIDENPILIYMTTPLALGMMDRMMGGEGVGDDEVPGNYTYTDLELRLYENLVRDMVSVMGGSWENYLPLEFSYVRTEVNPTLVQLIGMDETVVIVDMKIQMAEESGRLSLCLPGTLLTNIFTEISRDDPSRKAPGEDSSEEIFDTLRDSDLDVVAQLGDTTLSLRDIYHLNVGDVVDLGRPKDAPIYLEIGGSNWFAGRIGTYKKNMAVKIDEVCYQAEQRSE